MADAAETGRRLEQAVAEFFRANGYRATCNEVLEGRSGGRHEVDVVAEKTDALTTYRVAVECKAWQQPIEKDVVSKLDYVRTDLGLHKAIVVSLAGWRSGAELAAAELGIELWGPSELSHHLGEGVLRRLQLPAPAPAGVPGMGLPFTASADHAERQVRWAGMGRLQLRTVERLQWFAPVWLPAYAIALTVAQEEVRRFRTRVRSISLENLYEALTGTFLGEAPDSWQPVVVDPAAALRPGGRETKVHARLRKAVDDYGRVTTPAAVERHEAALEGLGLPVPCSSLAIGATTLVHLPAYVGILEAREGQRAVAVDGTTGRIDDDVSQLLTANLSHVREELGV
jgi:hypothetical protein